MYFLFALSLLYIFFDVAYFFRFLVTVIAYGVVGLLAKKSVLEESIYQGICLTSDLDANRHMNNARYLRECDFGRIKLFLESSFHKALLKLKGSTVNAGNNIRYRKSLTLFDLFKIKSKIVYWDKTAIYVEQQIIRNKDDFICAINIAKMVLSNTTPADVLRAVVGHDVTVPQLTPELQKLLESWKLSSERLRVAS